MMNDLISRQDAIDALDTGLWGVEWDKALATAMLKELPSAERKGKWEHLYNNNYECSLCGAFWTIDDTPHESGMYFCPCCGADMRGEEE